MGWAIFIGIIAIFVIIGVFASQERKKTNLLNLRDPNYTKVNSEELIELGVYYGGHPEIDESFEQAFAYRLDENIVLLKAIDKYSPTVKIGSIPIDQIKDVHYEDASTFEKRVSLGRVLLVGVFALAWKKKKTNEMFFVTIDYNDGRFNHSVVFSFSKPYFYTPGDAAKTSRNAIIKICSTKNSRL